MLCFFVPSKTNIDYLLGIMFQKVKDECTGLLRNNVLKSSKMNLNHLLGIMFKKLKMYVHYFLGIMF